MELYSSNDFYKLYQGNMLDMLEVIEPNSIDSIITDPPYELNFMSKGWDNAGVSFQHDTWKKCYEVLKDGGYLLAFGGSRTFHRIACAIEDAGFEIRDTIMWLYGSGFPKSMDISKSLDKRNKNTKEEYIKFGNYLKEKREENKISKIDLGKKLFNFDSNREDVPIQSWEIGKEIPTKDFYLKLKEILKLNDTFDWLIERKEAEREVIGKGKAGLTKGTIANFAGTTEFNITTPSTDLAKKWQGWGTALKPSFEPIIVARKPFKGSLVDNVIKNGVGGINIDECRVGNETTITKRNGNSGVNGVYGKDDRKFERENPTGRFPANTILTYDESDFDEVCGGFPNTNPSKQIIGGANRKSQTQEGRISAGGWKETNRIKKTEGYNDNGGSASRYFMNCKYTGKDEEIWKQLLVSNVENNLEILKAIKDSFAQISVEDLLKELKDHYAKYVDNQLDLIETSIVQDIVEMLTWDFKIETSQVIQDFIGNYKKCIQFLNLVQFVEKMGNIDTTQTTQNLLKLFGYVKVVITNYIQGNIEYDQKRYIYTPKASKKDRNEGLDEFEVKQCVGGGGGIGDYLQDVNSASGKFGSEKAPQKNIHPTVKPTNLMQYLVRLVTPNNGIILDPFNGSGSTGKAVMHENKERNKNYKYIGIEMTEEYLPISKARIEYVCKLTEEEKNEERQLSIYDLQ